MIKEWKEKHRDLLILDGGDLLYPRGVDPAAQGQKEAMNLQARAIVAAFNYMGCDAITIGEDDLAWGKENLLEILKEAKFPVVSANLVDSESGKPVFQPSIIKAVGGLRVGIFGLFGQSGGQNLGGLTVLDPVKTAEGVVSTLKKEADVIILLSHLGYQQDQELAKKVDGINVIVGGHTGILLTYPQIIRNTAILQVANNGRYLGRADLTVVNPALSFANLKTDETLRSQFPVLEQRMKSLDKESSKPAAEIEKTKNSLLQQKVDIERILKSHENMNRIVDETVALKEEIPQDPGCQKILDTYLHQVSELKKTSPSGGETAPGQAPQGAQE